MFKSQIVYYYAGIYFFVGFDLWKIVWIVLDPLRIFNVNKIIWIDELVRNGMDVNEHEKLSNFTLRYKMKVNEHERLSNFTLRYKWK
jgi:hypothetical protein